MEAKRKRKAERPCIHFLCLRRSRGLLLLFSLPPPRTTSFRLIAFSIHHHPQPCALVAAYRRSSEVVTQPGNPLHHPAERGLFGSTPIFPLFSSSLSAPSPVQLRSHPSVTRLLASGIPPFSSCREPHDRASNHLCQPLTTGLTEQPPSRVPSTSVLASDHSLIVRRPRSTEPIL